MNTSLDFKYCQRLLRYLNTKTQKTRGIVFLLLLTIFALSLRFGKLAYDFLFHPLDVDKLIDMSCFENTYYINKQTENTIPLTTFLTLHDMDGRMGNQMFQIASLIATAKRMNKLPVINESLTITKYFKIPCVSNSRFEIKDLVRYDENGSAKFTEFIDLPSKNITIGRFLQSWKYFANAEETIRKTFIIHEHYQRSAKDFIKRKSLQGYTNVCLHVRRGDLLTTDWGIAPISYIEKAIHFFKSKYKHVQFIVLSDDMKWCKSNIKNAIYSPFKRDIDDMALMTLCSDVIVTCGTFGWWGAWLANGTTVYFKGYPRSGSFLAGETNVYDYYPQSWIGI